MVRTAQCSSIRIGLIVFYFPDRSSQHFHMDLYQPLLFKWLPNFLMAASLISSFCFFMFMFIIVRGFSRLRHLSDISATLKRIEKMIETKSKAS